MQQDGQYKRMRTLDGMIAKLDTIMNRTGPMLSMIQHTTANPNWQNAQELGKLLQINRSSLAEVLPFVEQFQQQVAFVDEKGRAEPEPILTSRTGMVQHAVIEQMERIDSAKSQPVHYESFNRQLAQKIVSINNSINKCLSIATQKL